MEVGISRILACVTAKISSPSERAPNFGPEVTFCESRLESLLELRWKPEFKLPRVYADYLLLVDIDIQWMWMPMH
jgi:hypothetical protein